MKDTEFITSNHVFLGNIKQLRRQEKYITNSHPPITDKDMAQLQNSHALNPGTLRGLVQKVWFDLQLHLGRRGKERNRQLKPNSFLVKTDSLKYSLFVLLLGCTHRKRWSNILAENKENTAAPSTPKRLKHGSRSSSTDSDIYFNQCTIQGNVQINVTHNK
ncbi:unnamed protein product [Coregonus sp. 'balchen']|nr:unnamed protein product [Coregonus sp. 'balchen']